MEIYCPHCGNRVKVIEQAFGNGRSIILGTCHTNGCPLMCHTVSVSEYTNASFLKRYDASLNYNCRTKERV